eukprot:TRINITY_DN393_c0_g1_i1.p2 TRINITY_DN393_c0_g1~~TRINITY_DN393_c0_g1_i1.p2  ORF type:complete len:316 (-),score=59.94 TRINITY_DN393_c0_g1_i1:136-1083(-)
MSVQEQTNNTPTTPHATEEENTADEHQDVKETKRKRDKQKFDLPGQTYQTPQQNDPECIFYTTLLQQKPNSQMGKKWCVQRGLLSRKEAQNWVDQQRQKQQAKKDQDREIQKSKKDQDREIQKSKKDQDREILRVQKEQKRQQKAQKKEQKRLQQEQQKEKKRQQKAEKKEQKRQQQQAPKKKKLRKNQFENSRELESEGEKESGDSQIINEGVGENDVGTSSKRKRVKSDNNGPKFKKQKTQSSKRKECPEKLLPPAKRTKNRLDPPFYERERFHGLFAFKCFQGFKDFSFFDGGLELVQNDQEGLNGVNGEDG